MATPTERLPANVLGKFYVDSSCIDCDQCRVIAPQLFIRDEESGLSIVAKQPETDEESALAEEAMATCATSSIGNDAV